MSPLGSQKLAVLLCRFKDSPTTEPEPASYYRDLFEKPGTAGLADYWPVASIGHIDLKGSKVFGWKTIDAKRADYVAAHPSRWDKIQGAIDAFPEVDVSKYAATVAFFNTGAGDGGRSGAGVLGGPNDGNLTFLAHETGHVLGLKHSFDQSSRKRETWSAPGEYYDMHDVMSAMNVYGRRQLRFSPAGPMLVTPNLDRMGWLAPERVWSPDPGGSSVDEVELTSLSHPELGGYLACKIGDLYVEFRTKENWDSAIPRNAVLIHKLVGENAVVQASNRAKYVNDWLPGQTYGPTAVELALHGGTQVEVVGFDVPHKTARVRIAHTVRPITEVGPGTLFGGVPSDGGGWMVLPSGKIVRIPPRGPVRVLIEKLAIAADVTALSPQARREVEHAIFDDIVETIQARRR